MKVRKATMRKEEKIWKRLYNEYHEMDLWPASKKTDKMARERIAFLNESYGDTREPGLFHLMGLYAYSLSKWTKFDKAFMELNFMRSYVLSGRKNLGSAKYLCFVLYDCRKYKTLISLYENDLRRLKYEEARKSEVTEVRFLLVHGLYICSLIQTKKSEKKILTELDRWMRRFERYDNEGEICDGAIPVDFLTQIRKLSNTAKVNEYIGKLSEHAWDL